MTSPTSDRIEKIINLAEESKLLNNPEMQKLIKRLALEPHNSLLKDFEHLLTYKAAPSKMDPFYPYQGLQGEIKLGQAPGFTCGISSEDLRRNMLVVGRTGAGKTNLFYYLMYQLSDKKIPFWVFDFKKDYRHLSITEDVTVIPQKKFKFNPLRPPRGVAPLRWIQILVDVFGDSQGLLSGSKNFLLTHLHQLYSLYDIFAKHDTEAEKRGNTLLDDGQPDTSVTYPSMHELAELMQYKSYPLQTKEARYLETTMNRIKAAVLSVGETFDCSRGLPLGELLNKNVVFELEGMAEDFQNFLVEVIMAWVYHYRMARGSRESLQHVFLFDEARRIFNKNKEKRYESGEPVINLIVSRTREFGEGLVVADQEASKLTDSIKANSYVKLLLSSGSGKDINEMAEAMGLTDKQKKVSFDLGVGDSIVKVAGIDPFPINIPLVQIAKVITDSEVNKQAKQELVRYKNRVEGRDKPEKYTNYLEKITKGKLKKDLFDMESSGLNEDKEKFLVSVAEEPFIFLSQRYENLGFSGSKGNRIKKELVNENYLKEESIYTGKRGGRPKLVEVTKKAKDLLKDRDVKVERRGKGGLEHRYWQHKIAELYEKKGYNVEVEHPVGDREIDVFAEDEGKVGVEVAMSPKGEIDNLREDLKLDLDELIIACKDEKTMSKIGKKARKKLEQDYASEVTFKFVSDFSEP